MEIESRIKQSRFMNATAILAGVTGIIFILIKDIFDGYETSSPGIILAIPVALIMMSVSVFLLNYLKSGQIFGEKRNTNEELMREELSILRKELKNNSNFRSEERRVGKECRS